MTAPELIASMDIEGTTTMVCGSWLKCSIDFHSGTSFFCNRSNSACESGIIFSSDIRRAMGIIYFRGHPLEIGEGEEIAIRGTYEGGIGSSPKCFVIIF